MSAEKFRQSFHDVYPDAYYDGKTRSGFITLIREAVEKNNLEELKYVCYSLREIGTHASSSPASQMKDFQKWLEETDTDGSQSGEKYKDMLATLIRPEHLPQFDLDTPSPEPGCKESHNRQVLEDLIFANLRLQRRTYQSRQVMLDSTLAFLNDDKSLVNVAEDELHIIYLTASLLINNQIDRSMLPLWQAILSEEPIEPTNKAEKKLLKLHFSVGWHGLMSAPTTDGDFQAFSLDITPQALNQYVQKLDQGNNMQKKWLAFNLLGYCNGKNRLDQLEKVIELANYDQWPGWAKKQIKHLRIVLKQ